jgi:HK97 family phage major capsid protein
MMNNLKALRDRHAGIIEAGKALVATYKGESREPTEDELAKLDALAGERDEVGAQIKKAEDLADRERAFEIRGEARISGGAPNVKDDPKVGFSSFGEFATTVMRGSRRSSALDDRMKYLAAPTTTTNESSGEDGGFLVPPGFSSEIFADAFADDSLMGSVREIGVTGNGMTFPVSETTPWGTSGAKAYWEGEGVQLKKLFALVPITDELKSDAAAAGMWVESEVAPAIRWKVNDAFLHGSGVEGPLGVVGHAGTVQANAVSGQNGATVVIENVLSMFERAINPMASEWIANIGVFRHLYDMKDDSGNRIYQTVNPGLAPGLPMTLLGRPLRFVEACSAVGTVGDLIFGDWRQYVAITKGGIQTATSLHLWFDYDVEAFRATFRIDGQPWRSSTLSPGKGSATRGHFVTLETRS